MASPPSKSAGRKASGTALGSPNPPKMAKAKATAKQRAEAIGAAPATATADAGTEVKRRRLTKLAKGTAQPKAAAEGTAQPKAAADEDAGEEEATAEDEGEQAAAAEEPAKAKGKTSRGMMMWQRRQLHKKNAEATKGEEVAPPVPPPTEAVLKDAGPPPKKAPPAANVAGAKKVAKKAAAPPPAAGKKKAAAPPLAADKKKAAAPPPAADKPPPDDAKKKAAPPPADAKKEAAPPQADAKKAAAPPPADAKKHAAAPPPAKAAPSPKLAAAVAAADADAGMQSLDVGERRNLWMRYLRTRQVGKAGGREKKKQNPNADQVPEQFREAVEADPKKWFSIWVKKGNWKNVVFEEKQEESSHNNTETEAVWIWDFELERDYPNAAALRRALRGGPCHRQYPGTEGEDDALAQWNIIDKDRTVMGTKSSSSRTRTATGDQSSMDAATMTALNQSFPGELEQKRDNEKTPEEIAAEAEAAEARKNALALKKLEPDFQAKAYLRSLPKDIETARKILAEINSKSIMPSEYKSQLARVKQSFDEHVATLVGHRSRLEEMQGTGAYEKMSLPQIKLAVIQMQHDTKAWKETKELFENPAD